MKELFEKIIMDSVNTVRDEIANKILESQKNAEINNPKNNINNSRYSNQEVQRIELNSEEDIKQDADFDNFVQLFNKQEKNNKNENVPLQNGPQNQPVYERDTELAAAKNIGVLNAYNKNKRLNIMVVGAALGLILCLLILTSYNGDLPGEVVGIVSTISGIFGACLKDAYCFEFGSSRGSKEKDDKISSTILERLSCK